MTSGAIAWRAPADHPAPCALNEVMVGFDELTVTGIDAAERIHLILDGRSWCLGDD
jgi:hypothetical protein